MGRKNKGILLLRFLLIFLPCIEGASRLNEYIHDYETLEYDPLSVHESHLRVKRWIDESGGEKSTKNYDDVGPEILLKLRTKRKNLLLRLKRDTSVFSSDLAVELDGDSTANNNNQNNLEHIYAGHVDGVAGSNVFGSIREGIFDGKVITPDETFYVERANKYSLPTSTNTNQSHSVIYSEKDVHDPFHEMRTGHSKGCGITDEVMEWMERIQNSAENDMPELKHPKSKALQFHQQQSVNPTAEKLRSSSNGDHLPHDSFYHDHNSAPAGDEQHDHSFAKYYSSSSSISRGGDAPFFIRNSSNLLPPGHRGASFFSSEIGRGRRALRSGTSSKTTCTLSIQTDPLLWKHISEQERTDDENKIREEILSLIGQHVKAVNHIYSNTLFDGKEPYKNIRFEVQRIKIDTDKACKQGYKGEKNLFCIENIDVSNFLNLHSLSNHEDFCLSYVFTYRDFTGGTLGLAWVASASGASGGVCEKYKTYTETIGGVYQSTRRSLNTGIITFVNYNSRVPPKVSQLTLAHEIGHNFGSPHDYPSKCRPGGPEGNFIMFASATSGDRPNNSKFSDCSMKNVSSVLDAIIHDSKKTNCFIATNGTFCGNKIVEEGEMCDCGYNYEECEEECCYPRQISDSDRQSDPSAAGCRRKPKAKCSPSEGPCCDSRCMHVKFDRKQLCKQDTECSLPSYCSGRSAQCPTPTPKEDLTPCNNGTQVCQRGECQGSICLKFGLQECFLSSNDKNVDKRKLCDLACLDKQGRCRSTSELQLRGLPGGLSLRPGAPCDNFQGYCDVFLKCRSVDAEGPLARLKNLLFNKETLLNIAQWVTSYWWAVLLMGVAFIIIMGLFIKCCAVHTPSSNPKKAPHRRIGDTLRRPINTLRRHRHYRNANSPSSAAAAAVNAAVAVNGSCPPPPYSAGPSAPPQNARAPPPHGYGEGRGPNRSRGGDRHHDRQGKSNGKSNGGGSSNNPYAGAFNQPHKTHQQHRV